MHYTDGANVAYFGFPELHYSQVKLVVDELKRMGEKPLVVLPKKYTHRTFMLSSTGKSQTLHDRDYNIIKRYARIPSRGSKRRLWYFYIHMFLFCLQLHR
jgi:hypothetical protein